MRVFKKLVNNLMNSWKKREYKIIKSNDKYIIYKKIGEYDDKQKAILRMSELITDKITEMEVIKDKE